MKVQLETTDDDHPHKYVIDLTYSIATNEDCPSNSTFGVTLHQTIEVNIVGKYTSIEVDNKPSVIFISYNYILYIATYSIGPPTIHHSTNSPHTLLCITNTNTTATWIRFERGEDILGYCAPTKQIFDGDYKIFYPLTSDTDCVLQLAGNQVGVYVCSVKYPTIDSYLTSVESVTIDKENDNYTVIALSVVVGLLVITIAVLIVICTVIVWKRNNRPEPLNDEQPLQG